MNSKMKTIPLVIFLLILGAVGSVTASTMYVAPSSEVPLRTGKSSAKKIIAVLADGTQVELLQEEDAWALVRTASGKEGWILRRYLTENPPPRMQVESLKKKNQALRERYQKLKAQLQELSATGSDIKKELSKCISERDTIKTEYNRLKQDAANVIQTKKMLAETQKKLNQANAQLISLKQKVNNMEANSNVKWFLAGGGVLLAGWMLGLFSGRRRKRKPSLL